MKIYSNDTVSKAALDEAVQAHAAVVSTKIDEVDLKQSRQIEQLRTWVLASFIANVALTVVLFLVV